MLIILLLAIKGNEMKRFSELKDFMWNEVNEENAVHDLNLISDHYFVLHTGANVQKGKSLDSPLHAAAEKDCTAVVKLLLDFGADINARNTEFQRPVDVAPPSSLTEGFLLLYEGTTHCWPAFQRGFMIPRIQAASSENVIVS